jgi:hypothetical protein
MTAQPDEQRAQLSGETLTAPEQALLLCLLEGHGSSLRFGCNPWEFAVRLHELEQGELSMTALRALLRVGLVLHGIEHAEPEVAEQVEPEVAERLIQRVPHRRLSSDSCFILAEKGVHVGYALLAQGDAAAALQRLGPGAAELLPSFVNRPDGCRTLSFLGQVVRVFRQDAPFQEKVLDEFQAQHWAAKIANPLPRHARINRKRHLKEVVARLNDKQVPALLRFHAEGAQAVRWEPQ